MKLSHLLTVALASAVAADSWFGTKSAYNKWHETELERWLSDNNIPYPTPADRKDLENLVKDNWQAGVVDPLVSAGDKTNDHLGSVKDWIFDSWTESSLKSFLDHNNIPSPQPRNRDVLLTTARQNYDSVAKKLGEYSAYPGNWLYQSWSDSDLKEFLDARGYPVPQPSTRDKLVASVRRNARLASLQMQSAASSVSSGAAAASASAASAQASLSDLVFDAWSDSKLKEWLDENGVPAPQGSKKNELIALARKHKASLLGTGATASASSAYGAATSSAGNQYAKATDSAQLTAEQAFDEASQTWSDSRLKAYLDARGVPVPQGSKRDDLLASVRLQKHKAATGWSAWTFDTWTPENLRNYLSSNSKKYKKNAQASRDDLVKQAQDSYASASKAGGSNYASVTNYFAQQTAAVKDSTFDTWSESDLKSYLDTYGVPNYQGSTLNELRAQAKKQATYFRYGTSSPGGTFFEILSENFNWLLSQFQGGAAQGSRAAESLGHQAAASTASVKKEL